MHTFIAIEKDRYGLQKTVLKHVNLPLYYRYDEGKYSAYWLVTSNAAPIPYLFKKVMFMF